MKYKIESSFKRCKEFVAIVSDQMCINRIVERSVKFPDLRFGTAIAIVATHVDDSNEYGTGIRESYEYRLPKNISKEVQAELKCYLLGELAEESKNEIGNLRLIKRYLQMKISETDQKIEEKIRMEAYLDGMNASDNKDDFLENL